MKGRHTILKVLAIITLVINIPLSLLFLAMTFISFDDAAKGPTQLEIIHGELHVTEPARDPVSGIEGLIIVRKTEMLQYHSYESYDEWGECYVTQKETIWSDSHFNEYGKYKNPPFPEGLESTVLVGKAAIGESGTPLTDAMVQKFRTGGEQYVGHSMITPADLPDDLLAAYNLVQVRSGCFITKGKTESDTGCLRVTYLVLDPALDGAPITAAAKYAADGAFGDPDSELVLYNRDVPTNELEAAYKTDKTDGGFFGIGLTMFFLTLCAVAVIVLIVTRKKKAPQVAN